MRFINLFLTTFLGGAVLLTGCNQNETQLQQESFKPYKTGDKITLSSVAGGQVVLERTQKGFKIEGSDKILMLDIFGTYCDPCRIEAPRLTSFQLNNADDFMLIGLVHFEDISNESVIENFSRKYNAYYFISNEKENDRLVEQILQDIEYRHALSIPFKVVFKDGVYKNLTDINEGRDGGVPYYLGAVSAKVIQNDIDRIRRGE